MNDKVCISAIIHLMTEEKQIMSRLKKRAKALMRNDDLDMSAIRNRLDIWKTDTQTIID
jgi:hypothetical protein